MAKVKLTKAKAKKILKDKEVRGKPLTAKQLKFFGAIAGGQKPFSEKRRLALKKSQQLTRKIKGR